MQSHGEPKRVLLVVRWPVGGIRTFLRYMYRDFSAGRWRFTLVAPENPETRFLLDDDLPHLQIRYRASAEFPGTLEFARQVTTVLASGRFDLVHAQGFTAGLCALPGSKLRRRKLMLSVHETINDGQFAGRQGRLKRRAMARAFGAMDLIHSVSNDAQENLREYYPSLASDRLVVVPNGIEVERFLHAEPRDFHAELGLAPDVFLIGFMGRFMSPKGFRYLVDAVEILRGRTDLTRPFLVLTFGYGGFIREEKLAIARRGLADHFRFMPFVANAAPSLKGFDVLAMPSISEACPLQPMEALVCGTPLIATSCIGLREVVAGTPATVVPPRDSAALAAAIARHLGDGRRDEFRAFRETAAARFDVRRQAARLQAIYEEMFA